MGFCSALYDLCVFRPDLWKEWSIKFERYRGFITFLSPKKIKVIEEILLFNNGYDVKYLVYDISGYLQQLYVYDSDERKLEFHKFSDRGSNKYLIKIEFPNERLLKFQEYRTIALHYYIEVPSESRYRGALSVPLDIADSLYIHFEKPKEYNTAFLFFKRDSYNDISFLNESDIELDKDETQFKVQIRGKNIERSKFLDIIFIPELREEQENWFKIGIVIGETSSILILFELIQLIKLNNVSIQDISIIIPLGVSAITSMTVIKGWIFTKDMDWILRDINDKGGIDSWFTYDRIYIALILIITIEIVFTIILSRPNTIG
jgi:hypothetical protein